MGISLALPRALASGEIPAFLPLTGLRMPSPFSESGRGFPSPCVIFDAAFRMSLSAGYRCWVDTANTQSLQLRPEVLPLLLDTVILFGPSLSTWLHWFEVTTVTRDFTYVIHGSLAWWITSVRLGRCLPFHPCLRLSTRSPQGWLTLST